METNELWGRYKDIFWDAFHRPKLQSEKFFTIWKQLEPINDYLSGPLFAIYESGHCDYFFQDKNRFPWMNIPEDFMQWCADRVEQYREGVETIPALSEEEAQDKELLLFQVDLKMELADIAYEIQSKRLLQGN
jgi:hypothetical protein